MGVNSRVCYGNINEYYSLVCCLAGQYEITVNILEELWSENVVTFSVHLDAFRMDGRTSFTWRYETILNRRVYSNIGMVFVCGEYFSIRILAYSVLINLLIVGWWFGLLVASLFLRWGTKIQTLAWAGGYLMMPFSAVYYPLASLPPGCNQSRIFTNNLRI